MTYLSDNKSLSQPIESDLMTESSAFHAKAKEAGNRLSAFIMNYASAASGLFFWALVQDSATHFSPAMKVTVLSSLVLYVVTVTMCLLELRIDAKRFYAGAKELERPVELQNWSIYQAYGVLRLRLIYTSYVTLSADNLSALAFMTLKLF